ncbi:hypothetical protein LI328DRAFT_136049 [Trichoderma asperelloides]|nr:hypothetical protein LI328DRAFT_136049 [Trichoderma asperelloides]
MAWPTERPKLFVAGLAATAAASTHLRARRITICPSIPAISQQGGRHPVFTASKNMGYPFSSDHGVMGPGLSSSSCQVAA